MYNSKKEIRLIDATLGDLLEILDHRYLTKSLPVEESQPAQSDFINIKSCAVLTGYSEGYIRQLIFRREIPFYKTENRKPVRFKKSEILLWMSEKKFIPLDERSDNYVQDNPNPQHKTPKYGS